MVRQLIIGPVFYWAKGQASGSGSQAPVFFTRLSAFFSQLSLTFAGISPKFREGAAKFLETSLKIGDIAVISREVSGFEAVLFQKKPELYKIFTGQRVKIPGGPGNRPGKVGLIHE